MKVTNKPIPLPAEDRPVVEITLELTKKEAAILRDLVMDGFDWQSTGWCDLYGVLEGVADDLPGLISVTEAHPFRIDNGTR